MELRLRVNNHDGNWRDSEDGERYFYYCVYDKWKDLDDARGQITMRCKCRECLEQRDPEPLIHKAAEIANLAMMMADIIHSTEVEVP